MQGVATMSKLIIELPEDLHHQFRQAVQGRRKTMKEVVTGLIHQYLRRESSEPAEIKEPAPWCGGWQDEREPDEIVAEIKSARSWFSRDKPEV